MLANYTLIIPTKNRHQYLRRGIEYYGNTEINVIIVDSSNTKYEGEIHFKNISYLHFPGHIFVTKIREALKSVDTEYCGMCADDDFILPASLRTCVEFLSNNTDYVAAQGNSISFWKMPFNRLMILPSLHPYLSEAKDDLPSKRLLEIFKNYFQLYYSVHKTSNFKEIFATYDSNIKSLNFFEIYIAFISAINGKCKTLPVFYTVREGIAGSTGRTAGNPVDLINNNNEIKTWFFNKVAEKISVVEKTTLQKAKEYAEDAFNLYAQGVKRVFTVSKQQSVINKLVPASKIHWVKYVKLVLIYGSVNAYAKKITKSLQGYPFNEEVNVKELSKIKNIILKYPINN
ncbi:MAG TPA: TIGR00180 family glycosyltransferase [Bacteroidia bacterium]|jgi:glycosyltransferase domain-containing protein|nr:TIGR00180 family glycosyltransferase [Bacteroidia bacterium]